MSELINRAQRGVLDARHVEAGEREQQRVNQTERVWSPPRARVVDEWAYHGDVGGRTDAAV